MTLEKLFEDVADPQHLVTAIAIHKRLRELSPKLPFPEIQICSGHVQILIYGSDEMAQVFIFWDDDRNVIEINDCATDKKTIKIDLKDPDAWEKAVNHIKIILVL